VAVRFSSSSQQIDRGSNPLDEQNFSVCFWYYCLGQGGSSSTFNPIFTLSNSVGSSYRMLHFSATGSDVHHGWSYGSSEILVSTSTNNWYFLGLTSSGTATGDQDAYGAGVSDSISTESNDGAADSFTEDTFAFSGADSTYWANCRIAAFKAWDAVLTQAEIEKERWTYIPQRESNIHMWSPLIDDLTDYGPNGRDWTETGTVTYEDGPPISWGGSVLTVGALLAAAAALPRHLAGIRGGRRPVTMMRRR
jgi:hypothetical protein